MEVVDVISNGIKKELFRLSFCIGISIDQFTPEYFNFNAEIILSQALDRKQLFCNTVRPLNWKSASSFSKQKMNYGRRKIN